MRRPHFQPLVKRLTAAGHSNLSAADTARMLVAKTRANGQTELLQQLEAAMAALDPELLRLPDYERMGPDVQRPRPRRGR